ncbi:MAG: hypothetical protein EOP48_18655, partial [Sphingobacteriales bacterium]
MFKLSFKQQVLTGFSISLIFVLISAITSYLSIDELNNDTKWQTHTYDVIDIVKDVETHVINSETGIRGYILAGKKNFLAPGVLAGCFCIHLVRPRKKRSKTSQNKV